MGDNPNFYPPRKKQYVIRLPDAEVEAVEAVRAELWPDYTMEAVIHRLLREELIRHGLLALPKANRGKAAGRK